MSGYGRKSTSPVQDRHSPSNDARSSRTRAPTSPAAISPGITPHAYHTSTSQPAYFDPPISSSSSSLSRSQTWTEATKNQHHAYHQPGGTAPLRTKRSQASLNSTPVNRSGTVPNILRSRTSQSSFHAPPPPRTESPERYRGSTGPVVPPTHPWYGQNANGFAPPWMDSEMTAEPEAENETETETEEETEEEGEVEFEEDEEDEEEYEEPPPRRSVPVPSTRPTSVPEREITSPSTSIQKLDVYTEADANDQETPHQQRAPRQLQPFGNRLYQLWRTRTTCTVDAAGRVYGPRRLVREPPFLRHSPTQTSPQPHPRPPNPLPLPTLTANMQRETAQRQEAERSWESKEREKGKGKGKGKAPQRQRTISDQQQQQQQQQYPRSSQNHNHNDHVSGGRTSESEGSSTFARPPDSNSITPLRTVPRLLTLQAERDISHPATRLVLHRAFIFWRR
ncbi:hypothetical protein FB45DRAFT_94110 [Roridomyces roridus]|uniref:Uncharacterized protein n=1 Tax=Roridomyces roridus TaxID=1738132 RepID=A0AAD7AXY7_9AGAR|nr:hypothetical protein FB45DRAFT_94110 [Roridomyces roridus]